MKGEHDRFHLRLRREEESKQVGHLNSSHFLSSIAPSPLLEKMGEEGKKKRVVVESLGWLTESSIMPKKHKAIAGVGASSIMELKAHLYKSQEESKKTKELAGPDVEFHRAKKKITPKDLLSSHNSGVEARALKYVFDFFFYEFLF